jgi:hypothetical protein
MTMVAAMTAVALKEIAEAADVGLAAAVSLTEHVAGSIVRLGI